MSFWTDATLEPKRNYKFILSIPGTQGTGIDNFLVKKVTKPEWEVTATEHKFLNHTFYYPGRTTWNEIQATVVDTVDSNTSATQAVMKILEASGYDLPTAPNQPVGWGTVSKKKAVSDALGDVKIRTIDSDGNTVDEWLLHNAFITKVAMGELSYDNEEISEVTLTFRYDYAQVDVVNGDGKIPSS